MLPVCNLGILKVLFPPSPLYSMSPRRIVYVSHERLTLKVRNKVMPHPLPDKCFLLLGFHHLQLVFPPRQFLCKQLLVPKLKLSYVSCYLLKCTNLIFCMLILFIYLTHLVAGFNAPRPNFIFHQLLGGKTLTFIKLSIL